MATIGRAVLAVLAGATAWAVLWISGNQAAMAAFPQHLQEGRPIAHTGVLLGLMAYSVVLSLLAGYITALTGGGKPMPAVWSLAGLQLAMGIFAQVSFWSLMPVWYHLIFLGLIVPATVFGGALRGSRSPSPRQSPATATR